MKKIAVRVRNDRGFPIPGIQVWVKACRDSSIVVAGTTGQNGVADFKLNF